MMMVFFLFANYQAGDEQIVMDSSIAVGVNGTEPYYKGVDLLQPYPAPANDQLIVKYHLEAAAPGSLQLVNMAGQTVLRTDREQFHAGYTATPLDVSTLPAGQYLLRLITGAEIKTRTVSIQH
jgi:hypothetical protein